jgi:hypothetical protein
MDVDAAVVDAEVVDAPDRTTHDPQSVNDDKVACRTIRLDWTGKDVLRGAARELEGKVRGWLRTSGLAVVNDDPDISFQITTTLVPARRCIELRAGFREMRGRRPETSPPTVGDIVLCPPGRPTDARLVQAEAIRAWEGTNTERTFQSLTANLKTFLRMNEFGVRFVTDPPEAVVVANANLVGDRVSGGEQWGLAKRARVFGCLRNNKVFGFVTLPGRPPTPFEVIPARPARVERLQIRPR